MKSKCAGFHYEGDWGGPRYCIVHGHFLDTYLRLRLSIPEENSAEMKPRTVSEASQIFPSLLEALFYLSGDLYQDRAKKSPANEVQIVNPKKTKEKPAAVPRPAIHWLSRLWCEKEERRSKAWAKESEEESDCTDHQGPVVIKVLSCLW